MRMTIEHWWNDTDRRKPKFSEQNLSHCHFVQHKSNMDSPRNWSVGRRITAWVVVRYVLCPRVSSSLRVPHREHILSWRWNRTFDINIWHGSRTVAHSVTQWYYKSYRECISPSVVKLKANASSEVEFTQPFLYPTCSGPSLPLSRSSVFVKLSYTTPSKPS
jgi:hypothetical protein